MTRRSGQIREIEASSTQSMPSRLRRRCSSGIEKMLRPKSAANTRRTLEREPYFSPSICTVSLRSRDRSNCGSVVTKRRTRKAAIAAEDVTSASPAMPSPTRQLMRLVFSGFAILIPGPRFEPRQQLLAGLPNASRTERQCYVSRLRGLQQGFDSAVERSDILHVPVAELTDALHQRLRRRSGDRF